MNYWLALKFLARKTTIFEIKTSQPTYFYGERRIRQTLKLENNANFDESDPGITFRVDSSIIERIRQFFDELEF